MIEKLLNLKISSSRMLPPAALVAMYLLLFALMRVLHKPEVGRIEGGQESVREELRKLGCWTRGQKNVLFAFMVAVALWVAPGFLALITGTEAPVYRDYSGRVPEAVAAVAAAALLFVLPVNWKKRQFTLTWKEAVQIDWGTLILFGGGLTLGEMMFKTGLADAVGRGLLGASGATSTWGLTFAAIWVSIIVSEATSNTASATMVVPVIISVAQAAGVNPVPPALGATLAASWGFMLPVSTPPNAIVYGSGMVPITKMVRTGLLFDVGGGLLIWVGLRLMLPLVGLA
jgi:sodium-dependent dicarboxylate transporter 2/3/5